MCWCVVDSCWLRAHCVTLLLQVRVQQLTELEEVIAYKEAMAR
jgi:hypothetical protein